MSTTEIEKKNLEAHVEICAERYKNLETKFENMEQRMDTLDERMDKFEGYLVDIKNSLTTTERNRSNQLIRYGITIIGVLTAAVVAFLSKGVIGL
jgi:chromosome segregation ATPase